MGSFVGRGNQYIQLVKVLYCKLRTRGKQIPGFPLEVRPGTKSRSQRWEARLFHSTTMAPSNQVNEVEVKFRINFSFKSK